MRTQCDEIDVFIQCNIRALTISSTVAILSIFLISYMSFYSFLQTVNKKTFATQIRKTYIRISYSISIFLFVL